MTGCMLTGYGQTLKWSNGIALSSMKAHPKRILKDPRISYSGFVGCDYGTHTYYYLSSEIGFLQMGGKEGLALYNFKPVRYNEHWNYLHLNTTFRLKYPFKKTYLYAGAGPQANFLIGNKGFRGAYFREYEYEMKKIVWGGKIEAGMVKEIGPRWERGLSDSFCQGGRRRSRVF